MKAQPLPPHSVWSGRLLGPALPPRSWSKTLPWDSHCHAPAAFTAHPPMGGSQNVRSRLLRWVGFIHNLYQTNIFDCKSLCSSIIQNHPLPLHSSPGATPCQKAKVFFEEIKGNVKVKIVKV